MAEQTPKQKPVVVVTGSSGLIGTRLIDALAGDYRVFGLDIVEPSADLQDARWIKCDLTDDESVAGALREVADEVASEISCVVHLAAYYDFSGEPSPLYKELTVEGTRRLLRELQNYSVEQFIFSSSLLVMESSEEGQPVTADSPVEAEWDYPKSKLAAETVIEKERGDTPTLILRLAGAYDEACHSIPIAQQTRRIYEKQLEGFFFPGDKTHGQSFIHLDDAVECIRCGIARRKELPQHETLVIGEEDVMSYEELQDNLGKLIHGKEWPTIRIPKPAAKAGAWVKDKLASSEEDAPFIKPWMVDLADQNYPVDIRRARQVLQWEPRHTLRETLPEMVKRLQSDPRRWYEINGLPLPEHLQKESAHTS